MTFVFQPTGPPVQVVTVMDILATITTPTVILKIDVESFECRVFKTSCIDRVIYESLPRQCLRKWLSRRRSWSPSSSWSGPCCRSCLSTLPVWTGCWLVGTSLITGCHSKSTPGSRSWSWRLGTRGNHKYMIWCGFTNQQILIKYLILRYRNKDITSLSWVVPSSVA